MTTRRNFIKTVSAATALSIVSPLDLFANEKKKYIGIQLYTIREELNKNFVATMEKIADIGFNAVETAGYSNRKFYGYTPKDFKTFTKQLGINAQSSHANVQLENLDQMIDDTLEAGMEYLVKPSIGGDRRKTIDDYKKVAEEFNKIGEKCNKSGLGFAYHNHAFEFKKMKKQIPYNILLDNTEADYLTMQLDTYWMVYGGYQPIDYFNKYPGRFELLHIKDMDNTKKRESTEIGKGIIDFKEIFAANKKSGMKYFYLEQESFKMPVFESLKVSCNYLKQF
ncbi:MAG: sugar phosphate isomerase/epimerase [Bacteroidetes bacterium]|nr:MAG: sugar phosphate isomerase/epimerase [Bacteroidota bacterium]RLD85338.1 MAG: sugar phosphate isomerase/epimerase [Bacteroidota bacterium]